VYVEHPHRFDVQECVCRLHKPTCGLKQPPRPWCGHFSSLEKKFIMDYQLDYYGVSRFFHGRLFLYLRCCCGSLFS